MVSTTTIIAAILMAVLGFAAGLPGCLILNRIPAKWLCDYDEEPSEELKSGKRYVFKKHGLIMGASLAVAFAASVMTNGLSAELFIAVVIFFVLALVAASDAKYTIIPDQFTIAVAVFAIAFAVTDLLTTKSFVSKWYEPLIGAAAGAGFLVLLDLFSMFVLKKEGFGFGDIKLLAALGVMLGWKYVLVMIVLASFIAAIHFLVLIFAGDDIGKEGKYLPMGPYLCIAAAATVVSRPWFESLFAMYKAVLEMDTLP